MQSLGKSVLYLTRWFKSKIRKIRKFRNKEVAVIQMLGMNPKVCYHWEKKRSKISIFPDNLPQH